MLPVYLKIAEVPVLVVGGGLVAAHKIAWLLEQQARIRVVALAVHPTLLALVKANASITLFERAYESSDCDGVRLVIAATSDETTNRCVAADANRAGLWVNVVDKPSLCTFFVPASGTAGPVQVAVGTGGVSPSLAAELRDHLMRQIPDDISDFASALKALRARCVERFPDFDSRAKAMRRAARSFLDPERPREKDALVEWLLRRAPKDD
jgi:siroheme synthase-like protein